MARFIEIHVSDIAGGTETRPIAVNLDYISSIDFKENCFTLAGVGNYYVPKKESWDILCTFFMENRVKIVKKIEEVV